jgi:hypothetical protein
MAFVPLVLGLILGLIGAAFVIVSVRARRKAEESIRWPTTEGKVISSGVREHTDIDDETHHIRRSYEPAVEYGYSVGGTPLSGRKVSFGATSFDRKTAHEVVSRYPSGATVAVHYNPTKPSEAVLETKASGGAIFLVAGIAMLALSVGSFCFSFFLMFASATS